jgi:copper homeostasis protein
MRIRVEVCTGSVAEVEQASAHGADHVEVCTWLATGGVSPGWGLLAGALQVARCPVRVLVRPGPGVFIYNNTDRYMVLQEVELLAERGVHGVVFGALTAEGLVDTDLMREVRRTFPTGEVTFHRAIDQAADMRHAFQQCLDLGVDRVLTSGGGSTALEGSAQLAWMVREAKGRVQVAAAGGIRPEHVVLLIERTGVGEVHFAAQRIVPAADVAAVALSSAAGAVATVEPDLPKLIGMMNALTAAGWR